MSATNQNITYLRCQAKNDGRSIGAHPKNGAVSMLLYLLPIEAANTSVMYNNDQVTSELPY